MKLRLKSLAALVLPVLVASIACSAAPVPTPTPLARPAATIAPPPSAEGLPPTPTLTLAPTDTPPPGPTASPTVTPRVASATPESVPVEPSRATVTPAPALQPKATAASPVPSPEGDPRLRRVVDQIATVVSTARGIKFLEPVHAQLVTRQEIADYLVATIDAEDRENLAKMQELYWALGLLDRSVELYPLYLELLGEQVQGLFNLETDELLVVADSLPLNGSGKTTLAHELVHALQQQRFDARRLVEEAEVNQDQELALVALLEGDATLSSGLFITSGLSMSEMLELLQDASLGLETPALANAPEVVRKTLLFPYETGLRFVSSFQQGPGIWRQVNKVYARPPVSTEQILHPAKYQAGEAPIPVSLPPVLPALGSEWALVAEDVIGEFLLRTYLNSVLPWPASVRAASGWGGDRFRLLRDGSGQRVFVSVIQWDTEIDAQEFFDTYQEFTGAANPGSKKDAQANIVRWKSVGKSVLLRLDGGRTMIIMAPDPETIVLVETAIHGNLP